MEQLRIRVVGVVVIATFCFCTTTNVIAETMRLDSGHTGEVVIDESNVIGALFDTDEAVNHEGVSLLNYSRDGYNPFSVYFSRDNSIYVNTKQASVGFGNGESRHHVRAKAGEGAFLYLGFLQGTKCGGFDFYKGNDVHVRVEQGEATIGRRKEWTMPAIDFEGKGKVWSSSFAMMIDGLRVSVEQEDISFGGTEFIVRPKERSKYGVHQYRVTKQGTVIRERNPNYR